MDSAGAGQRQQRAGSGRLFLEIIDSSPLAVAVLSRRGRVLFRNPLFRRWAETVVDAPPGEDDRGEVSAPWAVLIERFEREGRFTDVEASFTGTDGQLRRIAVTWAPVDIEGEPTILSWHQDVTDRSLAAAELNATRAASEQVRNALQVAQTSLVQAESMASLGELVPGVVHEVCTPLGIGVTAASHLMDQVVRLRQQFQDGQLRKSDMADFLLAAVEGTHLLVANLIRADELIQGFKQVAVDRTSGGRRSFDLKVYIEEVLFSLRPRLKRSAVTVNVACPDDFECDSYPGALSQTITNLVINALVHAFDDGRAPGTISIEATGRDDGMVSLTIEDDGEGIAADNLSHIFEAFFTTRRGTGGSGLGLHIVQNAVTRTLAGTISVWSERGTGTRFTIEFPRVAPPESAEHNVGD